ncbi:hypothetical protein IQ270_02185 [Microcoleus sp. LEGE 07076]|uniref:hypothetical protein n=1 Tax=Microcoleus sp. LEGE 07076 TaxID=915322 RepID=UPI00188088C7|nr:hypothetical protein [Microcoleus sp. LEGE 07076]MBE9183564.1 hypothetical protein [Microcoleus sp. LEGE 07076]
MNTNISPILKVFTLSAALSLAIKYAGPSLSIPSSDFNALIAVFSPSIILAALLLARSRQQQ